MLLKKYANRRLYDTTTSRYVTLDEIAERIKAGEDAMVIDAADGSDLTQATLTQIILESRGAAKLLPVPLLHQLIRLGDDSLTEFFNRWISWALEFYVAGKQGVGWLGQWNPLMPGGMPGGGFPGAFGGGGAPWGWPQMPWGPRQRSPRESIHAHQGPGAAPVPSHPSPSGGQGHAAGHGSGDPDRHDDEVDRLRRELEELRAGFKGRKRGPRKKTVGTVPD